MSPAPAAALLAALAAAALLADHLALRCGDRGRPARRLRDRGRPGRRGLYLWGTLVSAFWVVVLTPLLAAEGTHYLWQGPTVPVLGPLGLTGEELDFRIARRPAAGRGRAGVRGLCAAARPRPARAGGRVRAPIGARGRARDAARARRSSGTRRGLIEALRGRGVEVAGVRGHARLLSPLLAGSLERGPEPGRGHGGARLRTAGRDPGAEPARAARPARAGGCGRARAHGGAVALATVGVACRSPIRAAAPRFGDVSLALEPGEAVLVLGPSGSGKSTLLRALAGLVPHFHGGAFSGRVEVLGRDSARLTRPAELAGEVATLFQDPEDQVVMARVEHEVAFGLENLGVPPDEIRDRVARGAGRDRRAPARAGRPTYELSSGELQRVCLAAALALRPQLLLLDEPTSQLDPEGADAAVRLALERGVAVVVSEHRPERLLDAVDRVLFVESRSRPARRRAGRRARVARPRAARLGRARAGPRRRSSPASVVVTLDGVSFAYGASDGGRRRRPGAPARRGRGADRPERLGQDDAREARCGAARTRHGDGSVRAGRAAYLSQDPGRYLTRDARGRGGRARDRRRPRSGAPLARRRSASRA